MAQVAVITNKAKDSDGLITGQVVDILSEKYNVISDIVCNDISDSAELDAIIVLGGDGTLLNAAYYAALADIPVLGINLGHLGFMTDTDACTMEKSLRAFMNGDYKVESRFMIDAIIKSPNGESRSITALNDIVVTRASYQRMVAFDVKINGDHLASYQGDGLVVATPTGSTAYSMSAGGPIVDPGLDVCVITPVCPHSMASKPVIVPGSAEIEIKFKSTFADKAMLTADGKDGIPLSEGDIILIKESKFATKLIKIQSHSFYELLNLKFQG